VEDNWDSPDMTLARLTSGEEGGSSVFAEVDASPSSAEAGSSLWEELGLLPLIGEWYTDDTPLGVPGPLVPS
jgi:hypothetical protein